MSRLVRERGSVGRRLWRRRKATKRPAGEEGTPGDATASTARTGDTPAGEPPHRNDSPHEHHAGDDGGTDRDDDHDDDSGGRASAQAPPRSMWSRLFGAFFDAGPPPAPPPYLVEDPLDEVRAVPRGVARLDAFERALLRWPVGSKEHRKLALAYHHELLALARQAGLQLSVLTARIEVCVAALEGAGENEKAGSLLASIGRRHQALERFVAAGAIQALEEAHAQIEYEEGGARFEAKLSFERFEGLFLVDMRAEALAALDRAVALWPENQAYAAVLHAVRARIPSKGTASLRCGVESLRIEGALPIIIGRGEGATVRLESPLVSRIHAIIDHDGDAIVVRGAEGSASVIIDGRPIATRPIALDDEGTITVAGIDVHYRKDASALTLWAALQPERRTMVVFAAAFTIPPPSAAAGAPAVAAIFDEAGRLTLLTSSNVTLQTAGTGGGASSAGALKRDTILLEGDAFGTSAARWVVARG